MLVVGRGPWHLRSQQAYVSLIIAPGYLLVRVRDGTVNGNFDELKAARHLGVFSRPRLDRGMGLPHLPNTTRTPCRDTFRGSVRDGERIGGLRGLARAVVATLRRLRPKARGVMMSARRRSRVDSRAGSAEHDRRIT